MRLMVAEGSFSWHLGKQMVNDEVIELLLDLIRIPSFVTNKLGVNENKLVDFIEDWLIKNTKLEIERQKLPGGRFNLLAKKGKPETVFLGHTDTVAPSNDAPVDQLAGKIIDNQIWGRGSVDMKSGVAALMSAAHKADDAKNFWIVLYADEEYDFLGMKGVVKKFKNIKPKRLISADGSDLALGNGCRGLIELTCRIKGETGHPAKGTGKNAIWGTVEILSALKKHLDGFNHPVMGGTSFNLAYIHGGTKNARTIGSGNRLVEVGMAGNVVADICEFTIDIRPAKPDLDADKVIDFLKKNFSTLGLEFELVEKKHNLGAWYTDRKKVNDFAQIALEVVGDVKYSDPRQTGYLDLQMLWEAVDRPPAFMFGGGIGSTAHKPDERINIVDLVKTRDFFEKVMRFLV